MAGKNETIDHAIESLQQRRDGCFGRFENAILYTNYVLLVASLAVAGIERFSDLPSEANWIVYSAYAIIALNVIAGLARIAPGQQS